MFEFYKRIADTQVDIVYLGETVCAKRKLMRKDDWISVADMLIKAGKEVLLSSMTLLEANSDLHTLKALCEQNRFQVEANDIGAVQLLRGKNFVTGPAVNIYNSHAFQFLSKQGLKRWVMPLELSKQALESMQQARPENVETELFVYGRMPLAYSARCFTARSHNLAKDDCQYRCLDYPDGLLLSTQETEKFLLLNGVQTQSAKTCNLIENIKEFIKLKVDVLRISPTSRHTEKVIDLFYRCVHSGYETKVAKKNLDDLMPSGEACNGYWYGVNGMDWHNLCDGSAYE